MKTVPQCKQCIDCHIIKPVRLFFNRDSRIHAECRLCTVHRNRLRREEGVFRPVNVPTEEAKRRFIPYPYLTLLKYPGNTYENCEIMDADYGVFYAPLRTVFAPKMPGHPDRTRLARDTSTMWTDEEINREMVKWPHLTLLERVPHGKSKFLDKDYGVFYRHIHELFKVNMPGHPDRTVNTIKINSALRRTVINKWIEDKIFHIPMSRRIRSAALKEDFSTAKRRAVKDAFHHECVKCKSKNNLHIDHLYPLSSGKPLTFKNCTLLCATCNHKKYDHTPEDFFTQAELNTISILQKQAATIYEVNQTKPCYRHS